MWQIFYARNLIINGIKWSDALSIFFSFRETAVPQAKNTKQLLDEVVFDILNNQGQGKCYQHKLED